MRTKISIAILSMVVVMTAAPAFAQVADTDGDPATIPEPNVLALIGIGAAAVLIGRRGNKGKK